MNNITPLEKQVMELLIKGEHPLLLALKKQFEIIQIKERDFSGVGFFLNFSVDDLVLDGSPNFEIGDVVADIEGLKYGSGFILFVRDGKLDFLEGYTFDEAWPEDIKNFKLHYIVDGKPSEQRDMQAFERTIS
jgi:hypothetical protein